MPDSSNNQEPENPSEDIISDVESSAKIASSAAKTTASEVPRIVRFTGKGVQLAGRGIQTTGTGIQKLAAIPFVGVVFAGIGGGIVGVGRVVQITGKGIEKGGKTAGKIKSGLEQTKQLGSITNLASPSKLSSQALRFIPGPAGLALRIKDFLEKLPVVGKYFKKGFNFAKKTAAAIAAAIAYALAMLAIKFAGLIVGALAGAAVGATIGFIIAGPPGAIIGAAVGAGIGGYIGWTKPAESLYLATHPQVIIAKPLGAINASLGNITTGVSNVVGGTLHAAGSLVTGIASAAWNGLGVIAGGVANAVGFAANFIGSLGSLSISGATVGIPVFGSVGSVAALGITGGIITAVSFSSLEGELGTALPPGQNQYFTLAKTANPNSFSNLTATGTQKVLFTITLTAKNTILNNVQVLDEAKGGSGGSILITTDSSGNPISPISCPATMNPGEVCTREITLSIDSRFNDSIVTNTSRVVATPEGQSILTESAAAVVAVGTPSTQCPSTWPTSSGGNGITQGPLGSTSHARLAASGEQAIDIGVTFVPTLATFNGVVIFAGSKGDGYGNFVDIAGTCNSSPFTARWAHLDSIRAGVTAGSSITSGQTLGTTGQTGNVSGPHLHYSFWGLPMTTPYIPRNVAFPSCNSNTDCNVNW